MKESQIYIVDDDPGVLTALMRLLEVAGYETRTFRSADEFLLAHDPDKPGCAVFDLAMPECDGLELQKRLNEAHANRPIIFLTGNAGVPETVRAMQAGAVDFLLKPVNDVDLLDAIARAIDRDTACRQTEKASAEIMRRLDTLTRREHEVLTHVIAGRLNKQIAADIGTVEKTVKVHRSRMMIKMGVRSVVDLVRMTEHVGVTPAGPFTSGNRYPKGQLDVLHRSA